MREESSNVMVMDKPVEAPKNTAVIEEVPLQKVVLPFEKKGEYFVELVDEIPKKPLYSFIKRTFDIFASLIALIVLALPMFFIAVMIKIKSPGPAFYKQERLGYRGEKVNIIKFRTMNLDAEASGAQWSQGDDDPRIFPLGRTLRKFRLDELPQFWNILKGDLSLVGPRPEREIFYDEFETYVHGFHERLKVKPGLTGLAQVNGGYDLRPEEKIIYDVEYIKKRSLWLDLKIILKTVGVILTRGGQSNCLSENSLSRKQYVYLAFKRFFDFVIAFVSLIILFIPFAIIAIIQKIVSPKEPVFFVQNRVGKGGKIIKVTKFRSMKSSAPHDCPTKDFNEGEQYITKWGRFIRDSSIDELPQLFQVLTGKMSLIGPRPLIPQEEAVHKMREQAGVYQLRPGMTGWAQVNGRDLVEDEEKVKFDRAYLDQIGLKMDIKILCMTFKKVATKADIEEGTVLDDKVKINK